MPASLAFVLADTPPARRPMAIGLWSASASVAAAAGPALGGVLVEAVGWRALFCINVPIGAWLVWRTLRLPRVAESGGRLPDVLGTVLIAGGVGLLVLGVTEGQTWGWGSTATVVTLAAAVVLSALAVLRSARVDGARDRDRPVEQPDLRRGERRVVPVRRRPVRVAAARRAVPHRDVGLLRARGRPRDDARAPSPPPPSGSTSAARRGGRPRARWSRSVRC